MARIPVCESFEVRIEIVFRTHSSIRRERSARINRGLWLRLARKLRAPLMSIKVGRELDCHVIGDTTFLVSDRRIVVHSSQATLPAPQFRRRIFSTSTAAALLLEHFTRRPLEALVMQARAGREAEPKLLRSQVNWLRDWSPELRARLGSVVVADGIAQFHPDLSLPLAVIRGEATERVSLRVQLSEFSEAAQKALKSLRSSAPGEALESLALNACLRDFSLKNRMQLSDSHLMIGIQGEDFARMLVVDRGELRVNFEFDGSCFDRGVAALQRACTQLGPKNLLIEVVYSKRTAEKDPGKLNTESFRAVSWSHQALGSGQVQSTCSVQSPVHLRTLPEGLVFNGQHVWPALSIRNRVSS